MNLILTNLSTIAAILAVMGALALIETAIPLHARGRWNRDHLGPNLALTFLTFFTNFFFNIGLVLLVLWLDSRGFGLFRWLGLGPVVAGVLAVVVLELSWYVLHRTMHRVPALWRVHSVHHSDPAIDVTTTIRQHPLEGILRYATLVLFVAVFGVGLTGFAIYRVWSALNGLCEHANIRLPRSLDRMIAVLLVSPDMHKVHHSRDVRETDTNYGNISSLFDRALGTFTPAERGRSVVCGLDGLDDHDDQTTAGLLGMPFRNRVPSVRAEAA